MWSSKWSTSISKAWPPSRSHQGSQDCLADPTLSTMHGSLLVLIALLFVWSKTHATAETSPPIGQGNAPRNLEEMWGDFDARAEPLETEVLKE